MIKKKCKVKSKVSGLGTTRKPDLATDVTRTANSMWLSNNPRFSFSVKTRMPKIQVQCVIEAYLRHVQPWLFE